ncbi:MAG TPA: methyltransferase domain-containing protein [Bryobacterales bacterium]|jgi:SAM-dependent methyltransferase|nr:methyltransferase domain-containing protein [Bryobacterales bacterium]
MHRKTTSRCYGKLGLCAGFVFALLLTAALPLLPQTDKAAPRQLDVPFVPTPQEVVEAMLKLAQVKSTDVVYDLGCGDGRIVITAAKEYGCHAVGIDINPERIQEARENAKKAGVSDLVTFREENLFTADVRPATVVTLYLLPSVNLKLRPRLQSTLKPGTRIVSHSFDMGDWKPDQEQTVDGRSIYLWVIH